MGGPTPPFWGTELGLHLTQYVAGAEAYLPSFIFIRPTVWPQCTNVTERTDRQDRQTTALQTVAQKRFAVCYQTVVCLCCPVLSLYDVGVLS